LRQPRCVVGFAPLVAVAVALRNHVPQRAGGAFAAVPAVSGIPVLLRLLVRVLLFVALLLRPHVFPPWFTLPEPATIGLPGQVN
jgi:hypothetical protein